MMSGVTQSKLSDGSIVIPSFESLTIEVDEAAGVAHLTLNRPSRSNALNVAMWRELPEAIDWLDACKDVRVVILKGAGKHFCTGVEVGEIPQMLYGFPSECEGRKREALRRRLKELQHSFSSFELCRKPIIAAIHGACIGGGIDMITACDLRYCTDDAQFSVKEVDLAITADVGTLQRLPHLVGHGAAMDLSLTGRMIRGKEAAALGLTNRSFATYDDLMTAVRNTAVNIAAKSPLAVTGTKAILLHSRDHSVSEGLDYVATWNASMLISKDIEDAFKAYTQKQTPIFSKL